MAAVDRITKAEIIIEGDDNEIENNNDDSNEWQTCVVNNNYEINVNYPYAIRNKRTKRIRKESISNSGYATLKINNGQKTIGKHVIVAKQWLPNPNNYTVVDHINHNRLDNRVENLRWTTQSLNCKNKTACNGVTYEFVEELSDNNISIMEYKGHWLDFYYFDEDDNNFYYYNGLNYRKLYRNEDVKSHAIYVNARDRNKKRFRIYLNVFKQEYDLL